MAAETQSLTAADIFEQGDAEPLRVEIPEWHKKGSKEAGVLWLRVLPANEGIALRARMNDDKGSAQDGMFLMIIACAVNEEGTPIFTETSLEPLRKKSLKVLNRLQRLALQHNGMLVETREQLKKD